MNKIERLLKRFDVTGIEYDDEFVRYKLTDRYDWEHTIVYTIWGIRGNASTCSRSSKRKAEA